MATQRATERLIRGLTDALGHPARDGSRCWPRGRTRSGASCTASTRPSAARAPKIQLWMRTAKQKRVVAFRTYLRTLLHEVGHHVDYALLRLPDSYHTEGFYKRESSLFYQLVPEAARRAASSRCDRSRTGPTVPIAERLERLERTPDELARLMRGHGRARAVAAARARRVGGKGGRLPSPRRRGASQRLDGAHPHHGRRRAVEAGTADRWAEDRQYVRHDAGAAGDAFRQRRDETLALLRRADTGAVGARRPSPPAGAA